jgi:type II secretory pathway pseudopilin PulG
MLLVMAASVCLVGAIMGSFLYNRAVRVEKENELIFRGLAYKEAIKSYYRASTGRKTYPERLEDLLDDPRFPNKKHIRKIYSDPITGKDWQLIMGSGGGIVGVASKSKMKPLKQKGFPTAMKDFEQALHYSDWQFVGSK